MLQSRGLRAWRIGVVASGLVGAPLAGQQGPALTLKRSGVTPGAAVEFAEPFGRVAGVRELRDGAVIVVDAGDRRVVVIRFGQPGVVSIGREGSGPGEYRSPRLVLGLGGDSSLVYDQQLWRFLLLDGGRALAQVVAMPEATFEQVHGADRDGRIYFEGDAWSTTERVGATDSVPILRRTPGSGRTDTLATIALPRKRTPGERSEVTVGGFTGPFSVFAPFGGGDGWTVLPDGTVTIVRAAPYSVEWLLPDGRRLRGAPLEYDPLPVTADDKREYEAQYREAKVVLPAAGGQAGRTVRPRFDIQWPGVKPPFEKGLVLARGDSEVWVGRSRPAGRSARGFDIFDRRGVRIGTAILAPGFRLAGFGAHAAYLVREDDDGLQYLTRLEFLTAAR